MDKTTRIISIRCATEAEYQVIKAIAVKERRPMSTLLLVAALEKLQELYPEYFPADEA